MAQPTVEAPKPPKGGFKLQGHLSFQGLRVAVENRIGSVRKGVGKDGKPWRTVMKAPYGYLVGSKGKDNEPIDVYVGPDKKSPTAFVVHQHHEDGKGHDEDKVLLGVGSKEEAKKLYLDHYDNPKFLGPISEILIERLKKLLHGGEKLDKITEKTAQYFAFADELTKMQVEKLG
jgi:hypothetical protein